MKRTPSIRWLLPAFLAAGLIVSFHDVVFRGRTLMTANFAPGTSPTGIGAYGYTGRREALRPVLDASGSARSHTPAAHVARRMVGRGELPLWNPHLAAGMPFLAEMPSALLFPPQWILLISDAPWVWESYWLLRIFLAGLGAGLYLRLMGSGRVAVLFGAYAYMLCGAHLSLLNVVHMNAAAVFPFLLCCAERAVRSPTRTAVGWLALALGLQILAGTAEGSAFALVFVGAYFLYRVFTLPERRKLLGRRLVGGLAAVLIGLALSAPMWIPFLEFLGLSYHVHPRGVGLQALPLVKFSQIVAPTILGPMWGYWDGSHPLSDPGYAGTTVCLLALLALLSGAALRSPWSFFAGAALFSILKVYGFPGFNWIVANLPPFDRSYTSVFLGTPLFLSLAVLAGAAVDRIARGEGSGLRSASLAMIALIGFFVWVYFPSAQARAAVTALLRGALPAVILALAVLVLSEIGRRGRLAAGGVAACLLGLLVIDLFVPIPRTRLDRDDLFREPPYVTFLGERRSEAPFRVIGTANILGPNWASAHGLDDIGAYTPLFVGRYDRWMRSMMGVTAPWVYTMNHALIPDLDVDGADLINLKYVIAPTTSTSDLHPGPRSQVIPGNVARGEILPGQEAGQTFLCTEDGLSAIGVLMALYARRNRGTLEFRLYEGVPEGRPIRVAWARMEEIRGNVHHLFRFDPVQGSRGKRFAFTLRSPDARPGNAVTVWAHPTGRYPEGQRLENGKPLEGDLGFEIHTTPPDARYHLAYDREVKIFENRRCLPRAYVVPEAEWASTSEEAFVRMKAEGFDPRRSVVLEGEGEAAGSGGALWRADGSRARVTTYGANQVVVAVDAKAPGYLVLVDTYFPGWQASVDGDRRPIRPANGLFRAVRVETGDREVRFSYRPGSFRVGLGCAFLAALALGGLFLGGSLRRRPARGPL